MNILIIQILRMGDALQLLPVIKSVKEMFPDSTLSILTSKLGAAVFQNQSEIDHIHVLSKEDIESRLLGGGKADLLSALEKLESDLAPLVGQNWDWILNFSYTFSSALIGYLLEAKHRSGCKVNGHRQFVSRDRWYSFSLASFMNRRYSCFNWVDINKQVAGLGTVPPPPYVVPGPSEISKVTDFLSGGESRNKKIIGLCPGAGGEFKRWGVEKFGRLGKSLTADGRCRIWVFGSQKETEMGERLKTLIGDGAENLAGKTTFEELAAFLARCDLLITNDTGPMHLAAAVGTRVVALFFTTHFVETGPYGPGHFVIHPKIECFPCQGTAACPHKKCLDAISPETLKAVVDAADSPRISLSVDEPVQIYRSFFDPWGNLDWRPCDNQLLSIHTMEKTLIKTAWLIHSNVAASANGEVPGYLSEVIHSYNPDTRGVNMPRAIESYAARLSEFMGLLESGQSVALDLQAEFLKERVDISTIARLSDKLKEIEAQIVSFQPASSFSFLGELLATLQENIEKTDGLNLSTRTLEVYRDLIAVTNSVARQARSFADLIP